MQNCSLPIKSKLCTGFLSYRQCMEQENKHVNEFETRPKNPRYNNGLFSRAIGKYITPTLFLNMIKVSKW